MLWTDDDAQFPLELLNMSMPGGLVRSLAPAAVFIVAVGVLTLWLLAEDSAIGPWLLAFLLAAHGWVHVLFLFPKPAADAAANDAASYPFDFRLSWLIRRGGLDDRLVLAIGTVLTVIVLLLHTLAALATVALLVPTDWWSALVVAAALSSLLFLVLFWSPLLLLGIVIDLGMLWLVLSNAWGPGG
jgi:hypothetical protein